MNAASQLSLSKMPKEFRSIHSLKSIDSESKRDNKRKRKQKMENEKANLSWFGLKLYKMRKWIEEERRRNRFQIPIMMGSVNFIEGKFGTSISSYFSLVLPLCLGSCTKTGCY